MSVIKRFNGTDWEEINGGSGTSAENVSYSSSMTYSDGTVGNKLTDLSNNKENISNKVTSLSSSSTDTQYPSAKSVINYFNSRITVAKIKAFGIQGDTPLTITAASSARIWTLSEFGTGLIYGSGSNWNYVLITGSQFSDFAYVEDNSLKIGGFLGFKQFLFFDCDGNSSL